jgi:hypothetical protein
MRNTRGRVLKLVYRMRKEFAPAARPWRQAGDEAEPARRLRRKVHGRKANRSSLVVRRLKDVRRQGTKPLTEQLADRIAGPAGSLGTTVDTEQVRSF